MPLFKVVLKTYDPAPITVLIHAPFALRAEQRALARFPGAESVVSVSEIAEDEDRMFHVNSSYSRVEVRVTGGDFKEWYRAKLGSVFRGVLVESPTCAVVMDLLDVKEQKPAAGRSIWMKDCELLSIETF